MNVLRLWPRRIYSIAFGIEFGWLSFTVFSNSQGSNLCATRREEIRSDNDYVSSENILFYLRLWTSITLSRVANLHISFMNVQSTNPILIHRQCHCRQSFASFYCTCWLPFSAPFIFRIVSKGFVLHMSHMSWRDSAEMQHKWRNIVKKTIKSNDRRKEVARDCSLETGCNKFHNYSRNRFCRWIYRTL